MGNSTARDAPRFSVEDSVTSETTACSDRRSPSPHDVGGNNAYANRMRQRSGLSQSSVGCGPKGSKAYKKDLRRLLDAYCSRSYGSHSTMTSVDHYYKEIFQYQRKIDSLHLLRAMGHSLAEGKPLDIAQQEFIEALQTKKEEALESALERGQNYQVGTVDGSGMLHLCPKDDKSPWMNALQRSLDEEYEQAHEEAHHVLSAYKAADDAMIKKLDDTLQRQEVFWETELEALFSVWQEATSALLDQTYSKNEVFEELDAQARHLAAKVARKVEKAEEHLPSWMKKPLVLRNHGVLSDATARLLHLELWQRAHGLTHPGRTELIKVMNASLHDKSLLGKLLFTGPSAEELAKLCEQKGSVFFVETSTHGVIALEAARAYFELLIRKNQAPPPAISLFPGLLRASRSGLLTMCAKVGNHLWVPELFRAGAEPLEASEHGTAATIAHNAGHHEIVTLIQNRIIAVESANQQLLGACFKCDVAEVRRLLRGRGNANCANENLWTPLHIASYVGSDEIVNELVSRSCDANAADKRGMTPLHLCVQNRRCDLVGLLVRANANIYQADSQGKSPLDIAWEVNDQDSVQTMLSRGRSGSVTLLSRISSFVFN